MVANFHSSPRGQGEFEGDVKCDAPANAKTSWGEDPI